VTRVLLARSRALGTLRRVYCSGNLARRPLVTPAVIYEDLTELARLCLKQAASTSNATAAAELRRMASEYQEALVDEPRMPDIAAAFESSPQVAQPTNSSSSRSRMLHPVVRTRERQIRCYAARDRWLSKSTPPQVARLEAANLKQAALLNGLRSKSREVRPWISAGLPATAKIPR
jgi:hypothetical protein